MSFCPSTVVSNILFNLSPSPRIIYLFHMAIMNSLFTRLGNVCESMFTAKRSSVDPTLSCALSVMRAKRLLPSAFLASITSCAYLAAFTLSPIHIYTRASSAFTAYLFIRLKRCLRKGSVLPSSS